MKIFTARNTFYAAVAAYTLLLAATVGMWTAIVMNPGPTAPCRHPVTAPAGAPPEVDWDVDVQYLDAAHIDACFLVGFVPLHPGPTNDHVQHARWFAEIPCLWWPRESANQRK